MTAFLTVPSWSVLPGIYATHFGVPLSTIALVLLIARVFDGAIDPLIGGLIDRFRQRNGTVKPLVLIGALVFPIATYFLYTPPPSATGTYFLVWMLVFYFAWTVFEIPHLAWGGELARTSAEKTALFGTRIFAVYMGSLLFFALPLLPFFESSSITPTVLQWTGVISLVATVPVLILCSQVGASSSQRLSCERVQRPAVGWSQLLRSLTGNRPLLLLYAAVFSATFGKSMSFGLMYLYVDTQLGMGPMLAGVLAIGMLSGLVAIPFWTQAARRIRRKWSWCMGMCLMAVSLFSLIALKPERAAALATVIAVIYFGFVTTNLFSMPFISEASDYSRWKHRVDAASTHFALNTLLVKTAYGLGGAAGFAIANVAGFNPLADKQSEQAMFGLHFAIAYLPAAITLLSALLIACLPLNARRHDILLKRLDRRSAS